MVFSMTDDVAIHCENKSTKTVHYDRSVTDYDVTICHDLSGCMYICVFHTYMPVFHSLSAFTPFSADTSHLKSEQIGRRFFSLIYLTTTVHYGRSVTDYDVTICHNLTACMYINAFHTHRPSFNSL